MKKLISFILATIMLILVLPISAGAENIPTIEAPKAIQYKLLNHDKVKLRWSKVENADCYYIYSYNFEKGKYRKEGEVSSTSCTLTNLTANTEYTIAVVSVKKTKSSVVVSKKCKTTFTTPDEWYYSETGKSWCLVEIEYIRKHYDGTGTEKFDISPLRAEWQKTYNFDDYKEPDIVADPIQNNGFVYLLTCSYGDSSDCYDIWRMDNDGGNIKFIGGISGNLNIVNNCVYDVRNLEVSWYCYSSESSFSPYSEIFCYMYKKFDIDKNFRTFSNIVYDGKYIYFAEEPLNKLADDKNAYIYRAKPTGSQLETIYKKLYNPGADPEFVYNPDNEENIKSEGRFIEMVGCDNNYLYFYCCEMENEEPYFNFYRMSTNKKNSVPQKIFSHKYYEITETECSNGHIYFSTYEGFRDALNSKCTYYCMKSDGTCLTKQDKPFEWRY